MGVKVKLYLNEYNIVIAKKIYTIKYRKVK